MPQEENLDTIDESEIIDDTIQDDPFFIPKSNVKMQHGQRMITSTSIEPSGNRMITANVDCSLNIWDFNGMNAMASSFKTVTPCDTQQELKKVDFSLNGEHALVVSNDIQCFILDREGERVLETIKGNHYIFDPKCNKGHSKCLNYASWNPISAAEFLTCGSDGSIRTWDIHNNEKILSERRIKSHKSCLVPKGKDGKKMIPQSCCYASNAKVIAAGCADGSLQLWDTRKSAVNVDMVSRNAHVANSYVSCVKFSYDGVLLASRAGDDTMKLFDVRTGLKTALKEFTDLYTTNERSNIVFSPNDRLVLTGTSIRRDGTAGHVMAFSRDTFEEVDRLPVEGASAVTLEWHPRLNQLLVGGGKGSLQLYYDDRGRSHGGALQFVSKPFRKKKFARDFYHKETLLTYDEDTERLARIGQRASKYHEGPQQSAFMAARSETKKRAPTVPTDANNKMPTLHQHMVQQIVIPVRNATAEFYENHPREAILRHAGKATYWTKGAYDKTQPNPIFEEENDDDGAKEAKRPKFV